MRNLIDFISQGEQINVEKIKVLRCNFRIEDWID